MENTLNSFQRNEIKKVLYKEKPVAKLELSNDTEKGYSAKTSIGKFAFIIPIKEAVNFGNEEPAQLLIRWLSHELESILPNGDVVKGNNIRTPSLHEKLGSGYSRNDQSTKGKNIGILWNDNQPLTTLQETCIRLGIPKSGNPELDALILESERKRIAVEAMGGVLASNTDEEMIDEGVVIHCSLSYTDELLKQLGYE